MPYTQPQPPAIDATRRGLAFAAGCGVLSALAACGTAPPGSPALAVPPPVVPLADLAGQLLSSLRGTPVKIEFRGQSLRLQVPQPHGFDAGSAAVKPALAAVLDQLVAALLGSPRWLVDVSGPLDAKGSAFQGQDRAAAVRDYLVARGALAARFSPPRNSPLPVTELLISERA